MTATLTRRGRPGRPAPLNTRPAASGQQPPRLPSRTSPLVTAGNELALVLVTAAAGLGLTRLFTGTRWVGPVVLAAVGSHAVAWVCRRQGWGLLASAAASAAGLVLAVVWLVEPHTTTLLIPKGSTWHAINDDLRAAWQRFGEVKAPTPALRGFVLSAVAGTWVTATTSDFFAFRVQARFEAMAPGFTLFVFGSILGADHLRVPVTALYLAGVLTFALLSETTRRSSSGAWFGGRARDGDAAVVRGGAALGVAAVVIAVAVGPHLPGAGKAGVVSWRDTDEGNARSRVTVSPLVDIRGRLVDQSDVELFTVASDSPRYWRLTSLDRFDGTIWSSLGTYQPTKGGLPGAAAGTPVRQDFAIGQLGTIWLPAAFRADRVTGVKGARFDRDSGSLLAQTPTANDLRYQVTSLAPALTQAELAAAGAAVPNDVAGRYLELPADMPAVVVQTAERATAGATSQYDKARRLQDFFRQNFAYDLDVAPGHDNDAMTRFLATRRGYCEQFAGTYAAMARALGLPARVAVGFVPGTQLGDGRYHVAGRDAHAWPEVYLGSYGWVAFEPTPGAGRTAPGTQSYTGVGAPDDVAQPQDTTATTVTPTTAGDTQASTPQPTEQPDQPALPTPETGRNALVTAVLLAGALTLLYGLAVPTLQRWLVRRRRRAAASPTDQVLVAWQEAEDAFARSGHARRASESVTEFATRARPTVEPVGAHLTSLAGHVQVAGFAPTGVPADSVPAARDASLAIVAELRSRTGRLRRLGWSLDPRPVTDGVRGLRPRRKA